MKHVLALGGALLFLAGFTPRAAADLVWLDATPIQITHVVGTAAPANVVRVLRNVGAASLSYSQFESPTAIWESHTPISGSLGIGATQNVTFNFAQVAALAVGQYSTTVTYFNAGNFQDQAPLMVMVNVIPPSPILCVNSPTSHSFDYVIGDPLPAPFQLNVSNCGAAASTLNWQVAEVVDMPWLTLSSAGGSLVGNTNANVTVTVDPTGVAKGVQNASIRFVNTDNMVQEILVAVELEVTAPTFKPGQLLTGTITTPSTTRQIDLNAVAGSQLKLKVAVPNQDLKPLLTLLDDQGATVAQFAFPASKKAKGKKLKIQASGNYTLVVAGDGVTTGDFVIQTSQKLPKLAKPRVLKKVSAKAPYIIVQVPVLAAKDTLLNVNVVGLAGTDANALEQSLIAPDGSQVNLGSFAQEIGNSTYYVAMPLDASGLYTMWLTQFATPAEKVQVQVAPVPPAPSPSTVDLNLF